MGRSDRPTTRRVGRPRRSDGPAVTRHDIVAEGLAVLTRSGYAELSFRGLARTLGVSHASVQHHFATKDELWRACVDACIDEVQARTGPDRQASDPTEATSQMLGWLIGRMLEFPNITTSVWNDSGPGSGERLDYLASRSREGLSAVLERLALARQSGLLGPTDPQVILATVTLGIASLISAPEALRRVFDIDLDEPSDRARLERELTDLLMWGITGRHGS